MKPFKGIEACVVAPTNELSIGDGKQWFTYPSVPEELLIPFEEDLERDKKSQEGLRLMKVPDNKKLEQHIRCKFGGSDNIADLSLDGQSTPDLPHCTKRLTCPGFGKCCKKPEFNNGKLSYRQIQITSLIQKGLSDNQIALELGVKPNTIRTQRVNIERIMGVGSKPQIAAIATLLGIW
jgi:DNA-binding CsgD family transcriptional regulator